MLVHKFYQRKLVTMSQVKNIITPVLLNFNLINSVLEFNNRTININTID